MSQPPPDPNVAAVEAVGAPARAAILAALAVGIYLNRARFFGEQALLLANQEVRQVAVSVLQSVGASVVNLEITAEQRHQLLAAIADVEIHLTSIMQQEWYANVRYDLGHQLRPGVRVLALAENDADRLLGDWPDRLRELDGKFCSVLDQVQLSALVLGRHLDETIHPLGRAGHYLERRPMGEDGRECRYGFRQEVPFRASIEWQTERLRDWVRLGLPSLPFWEGAESRERTVSQADIDQLLRTIEGVPQPALPDVRPSELEIHIRELGLHVDLRSRVITRENRGEVDFASRDAIWRIVELLSRAYPASVPREELFYHCFPGAHPDEANHRNTLSRRITDATRMLQDIQLMILSDDGCCSLLSSG